MASDEGLTSSPRPTGKKPSGIWLSWPCRPLVPFVINAQAGQPGYRVPLKQLLQADHTLPRVFSQHVICKGGTRRVEEGHHQQTGGTKQAWGCNWLGLLGSPHVY